jgi:hypothetical protein
MSCGGWQLPTAGPCSLRPSCCGLNSGSGHVCTSTVLEERYGPVLLTQARRMDGRWLLMPGRVSYGSDGLEWIQASMDMTIRVGWRC